MVIERMATVLTAEKLYKYHNVIDYELNELMEMLTIKTPEGIKVFYLDHVIQTTLTHYPKKEGDPNEICRITS